MRASRLLDVIYPRRCAGCGDGPWPFCGACRAALEPLSPPWCERCGAPTSAPVQRCGDCPSEALASARAAFLFAGPARSAVHRLKYSSWRDVGPAMGDAMAALDLPPADVVTWVPLARRRLAERGFDQAQVLATALARRTHLPLARLLRRTDDIGTQARRSGSERRFALQGSFAAAARPPARVLLADDVLTTGATAGACADALRRAGAREVHLVVAARALHGSGRRAYPRDGSRPGLWLPGGRPR